MSLRRFLSVAFLGLALLSPLSARAWGLGGATEQENLISLGAGKFGVMRHIRPGRAMDFRLEHRWGDSLLPMIAPSTTSWNKYFQIHPFAGVETTDKAQFYGFGGFVFDTFITNHIFLSPSLAAGVYERGTGKRLGSFLEFRSMFEAGYKFDNNIRVSAFINHVSNAEICDWNPGAEAVGAYVHIPTNLIFGH